MVLPIPRSFSLQSGFNRVMARALHGVTNCVLFFCTAGLALSSAQISKESLIANQYVRVSAVALPSHSNFFLRSNGRFHILIAERPEAVSVTKSDEKLQLAHSENLWTLDGVQSYQILNRSEAQISFLLLEIDVSPGRVVCSETSSCPWSIRSLDPVPIILSDHVTAFKIPLPWTPEAHSVIVPNVDFSVSGTHRDAWHAVWMENRDEVKSTRRQEQRPIPRFDLGPTEPLPYLLEIAFYNRPFCFCKRVRREN